MAREVVLSRLGASGTVAIFGDNGEVTVVRRRRGKDVPHRTLLPEEIRALAEAAGVLREAQADAWERGWLDCFSERLWTKPLPDGSWRAVNPYGSWRAVNPYSKGGE